MGDAASRRFTEVVLPETDRAYRLARWLTRSGADAEDVVQEAALRAFRAIGDFEGSNARGWFLAIVRRTAFTFLEKNRPKELVPVDDLEAAGAAASTGGSAFGVEPPETPEAALLARQRSGRIAAAVEALPLPFREVLVLREVEDMSYRDIAEILNLPIGTIMSRLARARAALARTLAEERS